jgi:hypothetical protein
MKFSIRAKRIRFAITVGTALIASVSGQEPSVVLKSLDNLEKRIEKVETETVNLRKAQKPAVAEKRYGNSGCYSDPADKDWNATQFGLRMTSNIK